MQDRLIGPGSGCWRCGEYYGRHAKGCPARTAEVRREREANRRVGAAFLAAMKKRDAVAIGKVLRASGGERGR